MILSAYDVFIPHRTRSSKKQVTRGRALGVLEAPGAAVSLGRSSLPRQPRGLAAEFGTQLIGDLWPASSGKAVSLTGGASTGNIC